MKHGAEHGLDADRVACMGESAGAWACGFLAHRSRAPSAQPDNDARFGFQGKGLRAMLGSYPPYDFNQYLSKEFDTFKMVTGQLPDIIRILATPRGSEGASSALAQTKAAHIRYDWWLAP